MIIKVYLFIYLNAEIKVYLFIYLNAEVVIQEKFIIIIIMKIF